MKAKLRVIPTLAALLLVFSGCGGGDPAPPPPPPPPPPVTTLPEHVGTGVDNITEDISKIVVETLADDRYEGRRTGTPGLVAASEQIVDWLEQSGVEPCFTDGYLQVLSSEQLREAGIKEWPEGVEVRNILGKIEGLNPDEYIFVGAHYDHMGVDPTLPTDDKVFNGADDNASGVAGVLQIARAFASMNVKPQRTVVFAFWDAEEQGIVGSGVYGRTFGDKSRIKAYFCLDMIGYSGMLEYYGGEIGNKVLYASTDTTQWAENAREDIAGFNLGIEAVTDPETTLSFYPTWLTLTNEREDQVVFPGLNDFLWLYPDVPVYYMNTGSYHRYYHTVDDESAIIDYPKMTDVSKLAFLALYRLANPE
jgi:hypothetical protein